MTNSSAGNDGSWQAIFRGRATSKQSPRPSGGFSLWQWIMRVIRLLANPRVAAWRKVLFWVVLFYILSPVDLRPDFIPLLGWLDDLLLGLVAYQFLSHGER